MNQRHVLIAISAWLMMPLLGCYSVKPKKKNDLGPLPSLSEARLANETVVLEVAFADVPNDPDWSDSVWSELDEQQLAPDVRQRLLKNGVRVGVVGIQLPSRLRDQLNLQRRMGMRGVLADMAPGDQSTTSSRRIQLRSGGRSDVVTRSSQPSLVVLTDDDREVVGKTFRDAQPAFSLRAFPLPDGRVRLELTPEIRFGPTRQRWSTGEGNMFQMQSGQDRKTYSKLRIEPILQAGQTVVIAASGASRSLGGNLFAKQVDGQHEKVLLIRLAQTNYEDELDDFVDPGFDPMTPVEVSSEFDVAKENLAPVVDVVGSDDPREQSPPPDAKLEFEEDLEDGLTTQLD